MPILRVRDENGNVIDIPAIVCPAVDMIEE